MKEYRTSTPKPTKRHLGMTPDISYLSLGLDSSGDDGIHFDIDFLTTKNPTRVLKDTMINSTTSFWSSARSLTHRQIRPTTNVIILPSQYYISIRI